VFSKICNSALAYPLSLSSKILHRVLLWRRGH